MAAATQGMIVTVAICPLLGASVVAFPLLGASEVGDMGVGAGAAPSRTSHRSVISPSALVTLKLLPILILQNSKRPP